MLPIRKKIAVGASLVMATAGVVAFVQSASPATSASGVVPPGQGGRHDLDRPGRHRPRFEPEEGLEGQVGGDRQVRRQQGRQEGQAAAQVRQLAG